MGAIVTELVETGEKRDGRGRRINSRERREEMLREFRGSGLTMAAYARREKIHYSTFVGWVRRGQPRGRWSRRTPRFAEVRLGPASAPFGFGMEVRLADGTVVRGAVATEVAALVRALRS